LITSYLNCGQELSINAYSHLGITLIPKQTLLVQDRWDIHHLYTILMTIWFQRFLWPVTPNGRFADLEIYHKLNLS